MASCYEGVGNVPLPFSFHDPPQYGMVLFVRKEVRRDRKDSTDALIECRGPLNIKNSPPYSGVSAVNHGNEDYLFTIVVSKPRLCCHYDGRMLVKHTLSITCQVSHGT